MELRPPRMGQEETTPDPPKGPALSLCGAGSGSRLRVRSPEGLVGANLSVVRGPFVDFFVATRSHYLREGRQRGLLVQPRLHKPLLLLHRGSSLRWWGSFEDGSEPTLGHQTLTAQGPNLKLTQLPYRQATECNTIHIKDLPNRAEAELPL